jgi:hypothetical protein
MKKILIPLNILSLCVIAVLLLSNKQKVVESKANYEGCNTVCMDYQTRGSYPLIMGSDLKEISDNHKQPISNSISWTRGITKSSWVIKNSIGKDVDDAHSAWFSLDDLKFFLWEIETKVCKSKCEKLMLNNLGVRIYFGRYPQGSPVLTSLGIQKDYINRQTVFMIPTFDDKMIHYDFLLDSTIISNSCKPIAMPSGNAKGDAKGAVQFTVGTYLLPDGKNHGDLCPPVCGGNAF